MSVSIISCPSCKNLVLSDTVQCPTCHHVLKPEQGGAQVGDLPSVVRAAEDEVACPDCGELVRSGLVRCWRCGGFLREEMAEKYQKMLDGPQQVTYSLVGTPHDASSSSTDSTADDDDFQLADGLNLMSEDELQSRQAAVPVPVTEPAEIAIKEPDSAVHEPAGTTPAEPAPAHSSTAASATPEKPRAEAPSTGDPLLDIALQEENEALARAKDRRKKKAQGEKVAMPGFLFVFCPNGHRIQVEEKYRGMTGRCPRCKSFFHVPGIDWEKKKQEAKQAEEEAARPSKYHTWMIDRKLHHVDPTKLKLKPGSLEKEFQEVDLVFSNEGMVVVSHGKQNSGLFGGEKNKKKREPLREEVQEHLRLEKELLDLPAAGHRDFLQADMEKITVVQPAAYIHESMFAGVPVFGEGLIAVRLPVTDQDKDVKDILFVSFTLSQFREFASTIDKLFGVKDLGQMEGVPLTDSEIKGKCHYSDRQISSIEVTDFHKADPEMELEIVGRKCQACGLVVSEDSRKKEKLGGANGKGIAKAKCPKCEQKFGDTTLYALKEDAEAQEATLSETGGLSS
jgi:rubredoxin